MSELVSEAQTPVATAAALPLPDRVMCRILCLPTDQPTGSAAGARDAFRTSIVISTVRCLLTYIVLPFVLPAIGVTTGVTPGISLVISAVAMFFITLSARRFWRARHPKRWHYTVLGGTVFVLLLGASVADIIALVR
jgi:hypothetical protein